MKRTLKKQSYTAKNYPLRGREAIIQFLTEHDSYWPMNSWNRGFCVSWDVKMHRRFDTTGMRYAEEMALDPALSDAWDEHLEKDNSIWECVMEDMARQFTDGDFTRYPGEGFVECYFNGRSGGHMVLSKCDLQSRGGSPWAMNPMVWSGRAEYEEWLRESLSYKELVAWYRMIRDVDICVDARFVEAEYQFAFQRTQWEEAYKREFATSNPEKIPPNFEAGMNI